MMEESEKILLKQLDRLQNSVSDAYENLIKVEEWLEYVITLPNIEIDIYKTRLQNIQRLRSNVFTAKIRVDNFNKKTRKLLKLN